MREDRASGELVAARQAREAAEDALAARKRDYEEYQETREERRDRIYAAIIGQTVSKDRIDLASEGVARIDEEGALKLDNVKRAESELKEKVSLETEARGRYNLAIKERMKIDEHKSIWLAADAAEQEYRAESELEDFTVRKESI
jgi:type III secretion protein O